MARISKTDHPRILHLVEVERRKVVEVAGGYGCTPANIYALLGKMRRVRAEEGVADGRATGSTSATSPSLAQPHGLAEATTAASEAAGPSNLFAEAAVAVTAPPSHDGDPVAELRAPAKIARMSATSSLKASATAPSSSGGGQLDMTLPTAPADRPASSLALVKDLPKKTASAGHARTGSTLAKAGFGLAMRTDDGDENITPFRSLDDLLSAIKPILRSAARSQDTVWFSIQPVDLATIEVDAA